MTASKYWGEERHSDAIYSVMLKKVRYVAPTGYESIQQGECVESVDIHFGSSSDHLQWETIRERVIRAGTVQKLVESLVDSEGQMDSRQFNVFFATYRAFSNVSEVFKLISEWFDNLSTQSQSQQVDKHQHGAAGSSSDPVYIYNEEKSQEIKGAIRSIIMCWLEMYPEDFYECNQNQMNSKERSESRSSMAMSSISATFPTLDKLIVFARARGFHDMKHKGRRVRERLRRMAQNGGLIAQIPSIARYSFAITGYDPNNSLSNCSTNESGSFPHSIEEDAQYARSLAMAQERAQMFDVGSENVPQIAEQLTFWDALFFRELRPYQCQGSIWGRRHKTGNGPVYSVRATIEQFNAISERVMTSILLPECRTEHRARIIEKWIDVAKELRTLRNLSSLKAIVSTLQSEPVFRLKSIWALVSKRHLSLLNELLETFELIEKGDNGEGLGGKQQKARYILKTEGTAKISPSKIAGASIPNRRNYRRTKSDLNLATMENSIQQGTVPWLGTFLTDLEKLDQMYPDLTSEGLINFEKRRKEFEVLAEIRLFQSAARVYTIQLDQAFCVWFHFLPALNEKECFTRSIELEPLLLTHNNRSHNPVTMEPGRRRVRDGLANISSIGRFFSALSVTGGSPKEQETHDGTIAFNSQRKLEDATENRDSCCADGIGELDLADGHTFNAEKPPRSTPGAGRSQSQGARMAQRLKKNSEAMGTATSRIRGSSPSPARSIAGGVDSNAKSQQKKAFDSEFNAKLFTKIGRPTPTSIHNRTDCELNSAEQAETESLVRRDEVDGTIKKYHVQQQGHYSISSDFSLSSPVTSHPFKASPSSPFNMLTPLKESQQHTLNLIGIFPQDKTKMGSSNLRQSNDEYPNNNVLGLRRMQRQQQFSQKSVSSSSSRSSLGTMSVLNRNSSGGNKLFGGASPSSISVSNCPREDQNFHLIRVGLDDTLQGELLNAATINYKCIKVINGDRMPQLIERALEKHMLDPSEKDNYYLVQLLPDGSEFRFPDHCNPFYAVAPDPSSSMLACVLRKHSFQGAAMNDSSSSASSHNTSTALARKLNRQKRNNLLRWSSGFL